MILNICIIRYLYISFMNFASAEQFFFSVILIRGNLTIIYGLYTDNGWLVSITVNQKSVILRNSHAYTDIHFLNNRRKNLLRESNLRMVVLIWKKSSFMHDKLFQKYIISINFNRVHIYQENAFTFFVEPTINKINQKDSINPR